ncbi:hypothetical protein BPT24_280 [Tenacibaculum phage pT24]|uniref:Uncharacterized protein n=1 Tax=Tenacibaculum phage pT24 TaxID=1880590 RepID=A0A1B4XX62_9CAUD|nr:hypothetical protein HYP10_gp248 [Tenacibaculum phage pT24]BAV39397.1 hypothetical protein BPT24_280 [Tenacibaculum phage pT24]
MAIKTIDAKEITTKQEFFDLVKTLDPKCGQDIRVNLPDNCFYKCFVLEHSDDDSYGNEKGYSYTLSYNLNVSGRTGYDFPMIGSTDMVKTFKTKSGCIRRLVKNIDWINDSKFIQG